MSALLRLLIFCAVASPVPVMGQTVLTFTNTQTGNDRIPLLYPVPLPVDSLTPVDGFRSYASLNARLQSLALMSDDLRAVEVGRSHADRPIFAYVTGTSSDVDPEGLAKPAFYINATTHAREWASPEVAAGVLERMMDGSGDQGLVRYLLDNTRLVIVPVQNVDGFLQTQRYPTQTLLGGDPDFDHWERDGRMRRKNMRGVDELLQSFGDHLGGIDLNRNHSPYWATTIGNGGSSANPASLVYHGSAPHAEPENQAMDAALALAPPGQLRLGIDVHTFTRLFYTANTGRARLNSIQQQLAGQLTTHHAQVSGRPYTVVHDPAGFGIGTAAEFFAHEFLIPAWTLELEPSSRGARDYGGTAHGAAGFILPASEIRRVRESWAETLLVAFYRMAGPPHLSRLRVTDAETGSLVTAIDWIADVSSGVRQAQVSAAGTLVEGRRYMLQLGFSKPMRHRVDGVTASLPGLYAGPRAPSITLDLGGQLQTLPTDGDWNAEAASGLRYRDDAYSVEFVAAHSSASYAVSVSTQDMVGQKLDSDASTPVGWFDGGWSGWEDGSGTGGDSGGPALVQISGSPDPVEVGDAGRAVGEGDRLTLQLRRLAPTAAELRVTHLVQSAPDFSGAGTEVAIWGPGEGGERSLRVVLADDVQAQGDRSVVLTLGASSGSEQFTVDHSVEVLDNDSAELAVLRAVADLAPSLQLRDASQRPQPHAVVLDGNTEYRVQGNVAPLLLQAPLEVFGSGAVVGPAGPGVALLHASGDATVTLDALRLTSLPPGAAAAPVARPLTSNAAMLELTRINHPDGVSDAFLDSEGAVSLTASSIFAGHGSALRTSADATVDASILHSDGDVATVVASAGLLIDASTVVSQGAAPALSAAGAITLQRSLLQAPAQQPVCAQDTAAGADNLLSDGSCGLSNADNQLDLRLTLAFDPETGAYAVPETALDSHPCDAGADYRGAARPQSSEGDVDHCDVGAIEVGINPYRGLWIPARTGHGLDLQTAGNRLVVVWYSYGADGEPAVYQAVGELTGARFEAPLLRSRQVDGEQVTEEIGSFGLDFESDTRATLRWQFAGNDPGSEVLQAYVFAEGPPRIEATGLWYDPADSGWGISLTRLGAVSAMALYYWDAEGEMRWALGTADDADAMRFDLLTFTGFCPDCDAAANPPIATPAGTASLHVHTPRRMRVDIDLQHEGQGDPEWLRQHSMLVPITDPVDNRQAVSEVLGGD